MSLARLLFREQFAFLARDRRGWSTHLDAIRAFLGEGLRRADPGRPVLILGAGSGLEVPWRSAPPRAAGWDADPLARLRTAFRHLRWPTWVNGDFCSAFDRLEATAERCVKEGWSGRRRDPERAARRLAGLLPSLDPEPLELRRWLETHRPGTILSANVLGQLGVGARRLVERRFAPHSPWESDPEAPDALDAALEAWTRRLLERHFALLRESGAELWLAYDRAFLDPDPGLRLGDWSEDWRAQLRSEASRIEAQDPLCGADPLAALAGRQRLREGRWLWPLGPGQLHLMEAVAVAGDPPR